MPIRLCRAQRAAHSVIKTPSPSHIWISDDVLHESLHAFVSARLPSNSKRHGSNLPGPLEARRRSSKRRMGYLGAAAGQLGASSPSSMDAALTFGWFGDRRGSSVELQDLNWLPPGAVDAARKSRHAYPNLPAWLDVRHPVRREEVFDLDRILGPPPKLEAISVEEYKALVWTKRTLQEIRELNKEVGNACLDARMCSMIAFERLLATYQSLQAKQGRTAADVLAQRELLFEFLEDEQLELSGGQNLKSLIKALADEDLSLQQFNVLRNHTIAVIPTLAFDNLLFRKHWTEAIESLVQLCINTSTETAQPELLVELFEQLWHTRSAKEVRGVVAARILDHLVDIPISSRTIDLAADIYNTSDVNIAARITKMSRLVRKVIAADVEHQRVHPSQISKSNLAILLTSLRKDNIGGIARKVTLDLVNNLDKLEERDANLRTLSFWSEALRSSRDCAWHVGMKPKDVEAALNNIAAVARPAEVVFLFHGFSGTGISRTLMRHWIPHLARINGAGGECLHNDSMAVLQQSWQKHFAQLDRSSGHFLNTDQVALASSVETARKHDLDWEALLTDILDLTKALNLHADIDGLVRGLERLHSKSTLTTKHRHFLSNYINEQSGKDVFSALRMFKADTRLDLSDHPNLALNTLKSPNVNIHEILALLNKPDRDATLAPALRKHNPECDLSDARIDLIHQTASTIATSNKFTLRQSSSTVHYCWRLLKSAQAPMDERLARAAVMAGIVRPMAADEWIPTKQYKWALNVVTAVHGEEAATKLDEMVYSMRPKRTWDLSPPKKEEETRSKKELRVVRGLTVLQKSSVGDADVRMMRKGDWLNFRTAQKVVGRSSGLKSKSKK